MQRLQGIEAEPLHSISDVEQREFQSRSELQDWTEILFSTFWVF
jgi:hypothetical protein